MYILDETEFGRIVLDTWPKELEENRSPEFRILGHETAQQIAIDVFEEICEACDTRTFILAWQNLKNLGATTPHSEHIGPVAPEGFPLLVERIALRRITEVAEKRGVATEKWDGHLSLSHLLMDAMVYNLDKVEDHA